MTMGNYQAGLTTTRKRATTSLYDQGVQVGLVSGGYFQTELHSLNLEVDQMDKAVGVARGLDADGRPRPVTQDQEDWFKASWAPFFKAWRGFFGEYAFGWKSNRLLPIVTSRLEQLEDYRKRFIAIRAQAEKLHDNPVFRNLPAPTAVKKYESWWEDLVNAIGGALKSGIIWILVAIAGVGLIYVFVKRAGGGPSLAFGT